MTTPQRTIQIMGQPTAHPNVCKFVVDHPIYPGGTYNCRNLEMAEGSPLLEALFGLSGIQQIMLQNNVITIDKNSDEPWSSLGKKIGTAIREQIMSGKPLISAEIAPTSTPQPPNDERMAAQIRTLLVENINPAVASHGGSVELVEVKGGNVYLQMGGGCQGCSAASFTLQMSVERILRSHVPAIGKIIDVTDHKAGHNPYY